jgi:hypothetical protein
VAAAEAAIELSNYRGNAYYAPLSAHVGLPRKSPSSWAPTHAFDVGTSAPNADVISERLGPISLESRPRALSSALELPFTCASALGHTAAYGPECFLPPSLHHAIDGYGRQAMNSVHERSARTPRFAPVRTSSSASPALSHKRTPFRNGTKWGR